MKKCWFEVELGVQISWWSVKLVGFNWPQRSTLTQQRTKPPRMIKMIFAFFQPWDVQRGNGYYLHAVLVLWDILHFFRLPLLQGHHVSDRLCLWLSGGLPHLPRGEHPAHVGQHLNSRQCGCAFRPYHLAGAICRPFHAGLPRWANYGYSRFVHYSTCGSPEVSGITLVCITHLIILWSSHGPLQSLFTSKLWFM